MREDNDQILFEVQSTLFKKSVHSHLRHTFFVPEHTESIYIDFNFDPPNQTNIDENKKIVKQAFTFYDYGEPMEKDFGPVRNMLTLSVDDPDGFRGARHYHSPVQHVELNNIESAPGYLIKNNPAGLWSITVSVHALVTDKCEFYLCVYRKPSPIDKHQNTNYSWQSRPLLENIKESKCQYQPNAILHKNRDSERWVAMELHSHTFHSDGKQSVLEMATVAKKMGLEAVVVTDHNTISPLQFIEEVEKEVGIHILYGLEWTTFYGHMLTMGYRTPSYTDWREIGPLNIEEAIKGIHENGAIAGIAHPFRIGNPIGTGCHWEFPIEHIDSIDFIEVWNSTRPGNSSSNQRAFEFWTELLNKGYRLTATAGRDWHHNEIKNPLPAISYILIPENSTIDKAVFRAAFIEAIKTGKLTISYGNPLIIRITQGMNVYSIGDTIGNNHDSLLINIHTDEWKTNDRINAATFQIVLVSNHGEMYRSPVGSSSLELQLESSALQWIRAELYASVDQQKPEMIAFTNPIFFASDN